MQFPGTQTYQPLQPRRRKLDPAKPSYVLLILRTAAKKKKRCPTNEEIRQELLSRGFSFPSYCFPSSMAKHGLLKVEVYGKNWRVVEIEGHRTMESPIGGNPYRVFEKGEA